MIIRKSPNTPKSWTFFSNLEVWSENVHVLLQVFCIYTSLRMTKVLASVRQRWKNTHICSQTLQRDEVTVSDNPIDCWKNFITADFNSNDLEKCFCRTGCCCWNLIHHQHIRSSTRISEPLKVNNRRGDKASRHLLPSKEYSWEKDLETKVSWLPGIRAINMAPIYRCIPSLGVGRGDRKMFIIPRKAVKYDRIVHPKLEFQLKN